MRRFGFALLVVVTVLVFTPKAIADPITVSNALAGINDVSFNSTSITFTNSGLTTAPGSGGTFSGVLGPVTSNGFTFSSPDRMEVFDVTGGVGAPASSTIEGNKAEAIVNGILTITGSGLLAEAGYGTNNATFDLNVGSSGQSAAVEITAVGAPEPSSLLLLGTGLLGLAFVLFRKAKSPGVAAHK